MNTLERLYIHSTYLEDLKPIASLTQLKTLSVGGLEFMSMGSSGKLEDISPIGGLINLEYLSVSDCQVEDISCIKNLYKLKHLQVFKLKYTIFLL